MILAVLTQLPIRSGIIAYGRWIKIRPFLLALLICALALPPGFACAAPTDPPKKTPTEMPGYSTDDLRKLSDIISRTGVSSDAIPALYRPQYLSISDADLSMENEDIVFIVNYPGNLVRIYPRRILVWHEAVNDILPTPAGRLPSAQQSPVPDKEVENLTITYSPLTGSVVGFRSMAGKYPSSFGLSGNLLNGNSVLYDRISRSLWIQLLGICVEGPFLGKRLTRVPVLSARWKGVKDRYGGLDSQFTGRAEVLSRSTGFTRSYGKDPYGTYARKGSYYDDLRLPFAVDRIDTRLPPKTPILGLELENSSGAVLKDEVRKERVINFSLGAVPMMAVHDEEIDAVRVFERTLTDLDQPLTFSIFEDKLVDDQSKSEWRADGECVYGRLRNRTLKPVLAIDSMWFAWASFYRNTQIIPGSSF